MKSTPEAGVVSGDEGEEGRPPALVASIEEPVVPSEKAKFLVFVKILLRCLEISGNTKLKSLVKDTVFECTRRHRAKLEGFSTDDELLEETKRRLRRLVGELYWVQAKRHTDQFCQRRSLARRVSS